MSAVEDTKGRFVVSRLNASSADFVGVATTSNGYRLDKSDGTSRLATKAEVDAAVAWADARMAEIAADADSATNAKLDNVLKTLIGMTPAQIETWGNANITTIVQARTAIIGLAKAVSILARRSL